MRKGDDFCDCFLVEEESYEENDNVLYIKEGFPLVHLAMESMMKITQNSLEGFALSL